MRYLPNSKIMQKQYNMLSYENIKHILYIVNKYMLMYNRRKIVDIEERCMNKYIYIIGTVFVLSVVATLFIKLLPFLIVAGIVIYGITALKGKSIAKKQGEMKKEYKSNNHRNNNVSDVYNSSDNYTDGEIIDVYDYEDVEKK